MYSVLAAIFCQKFFVWSFSVAFVARGKSEMVKKKKKMYVKRDLNTAYSHRKQSYYSICGMFIVTEETLLHSSQSPQKNTLDCN